MMPMTDRPIQPATMTYQQAAAYIGVSVVTVKRLVADGTLRHVPIGRTDGRKLVRFRQADLDAYLDGEARGGSPAVD